MYLLNNNVTYFDSFRVEHIPKEIKKFIGNKNRIRNLFSIQAYDSVMCEYFCTAFIYGFIDYRNLNDQQFRLNKVSEVRDYFIGEIKERELMSKRIGKYIASFDHFDKSLIVLSVTTGSISITSFATVIGPHVGIASESFSLAFSMSTGIVKNC